MKKFILFAVESLVMGWFMFAFLSLGIGFVLTLLGVIWAIGELIVVVFQIPQYCVQEDLTLGSIWIMIGGFSLAFGSVILILHVHNDWKYNDYMFDNLWKWLGLI